MSSTQNLHPVRRGHIPPRQTQSGSISDISASSAAPGVMHPFLLVCAASERGSCSPSSGRPFASIAPFPFSEHARERRPTEPLRTTKPQTSAPGRQYGGIFSPAGSSSTDTLQCGSSCAFSWVSPSPSNPARSRNPAHGHVKSSGKKWRIP